MQFHSPARTDASIPDDLFESGSFELPSEIDPSEIDQGTLSLSRVSNPIYWSQSHQKENAQSEPPTVAKRRPIPRKGHTKSRRGCYSCKRRKIKCQETKPSCEHCQKAGIVCKYPVPSPADDVARIESPMMPLQSTPIVFSMQDMRFFHHFIVSAFPILPAGAESVWSLEVPGMAHQVRMLLMLRANIDRFSVRLFDSRHARTWSL